MYLLFFPALKHTIPFLQMHQLFELITGTLWSLENKFKKYEKSLRHYSQSPHAHFFTLLLLLIFFTLFYMFVYILFFMSNYLYLLYSILLSESIPFLRKPFGYVYLSLWLFEVIAFITFLKAIEFAERFRLDNEIFLIFNISDLSFVGFELPRFVRFG